VTGEAEDRTWQRLDKWLWCARFMKVRAACSRWVADGSVRINRQPTDKPHARLRPGDVLTLPVPNGVRVVRVLALAARRGPAPEARLLYEELTDPAVACTGGESSSYRPHLLDEPDDD
jgi:ribosome-associated heat shock protein Hsp15